MTQWNFLDLEDELIDYATSKIAMLPCPYDGTSSWLKGADRGPRVLVDASPQLEDYDAELNREPCRAGIHVLPPVQFADDDPARAVAAIEAAARPAVADGKFLFGLGGEHTVTVGLTRAVRQIRGPFSVLQIDAHFDLRDEYQGSPYNHACVMRRVASDDPAASLVAIGVRSFIPEELGFARERGIHYVEGRHTRSSDWIEPAIAALGPTVYVTVDLDGLDPTVMPATGTPVPGGVEWFPLLELLRTVGQQRSVIACDINEFRPDPAQRHADLTAALLAYKMIGYFTG